MEGRQRGGLACSSDGGVRERDRIVFVVRLSFTKWIFNGSYPVGMQR